MAETSAEYVAGIRSTLGEMTTDTERLNLRLEDLLYGRTAPTIADSTSILLEVRAWRKKLRQMKSK
jgi:hypothetical protein